jgi:hypothetical protein
VRRTVLLLASVVLAVLLFAAVPGSASPTAARRAPPDLTSSSCSPTICERMISGISLLNSDRVKELTAWYRNRLRTLQAVDEGVAALVKELREQGERSNTYIFMYSDNGFHLGEHRLALQKRPPYEHAIRVPLVVRGPGVPAGTTRGEFALNIDLAPTFADLAHTIAPSLVDGRSLTPLLRGGAPSTWRSAFLLELNRDNTSRAYGVRTARRKYIEYADGFRELYQLKTEAYELVNSYDEEVMPPALAARLQPSRAAPVQRAARPRMDRSKDADSQEGDCKRSGLHDIRSGSRCVTRLTFAYESRRL